MRNGDVEPRKVFSGARDAPVAVRLTSSGQRGLRPRGGLAVGSTSGQRLLGRRWSLNRYADEVGVSVQCLCTIVGGRLSGPLGLPSVFTLWQTLVCPSTPCSWHPFPGPLLIFTSSWGPCWVMDLQGHRFLGSALGLRLSQGHREAPGREDASLPLCPQLVPPA